MRPENSRAQIEKIPRQTEASAHSTALCVFASVLKYHQLRRSDKGQVTRDKQPLDWNCGPRRQSSRLHYSPPESFQQRKQHTTHIPTTQSTPTPLHLVNPFGRNSTIRRIITV